MGHINLAFFQSPVSGVTKCADVVVNPDFGDLPLNVDLSTATTGAHIFYLIGVGTNPTTPIHNGDNATSPTVRIGSNGGTVFLGNTGAQNRWISAIAYQGGLLDSNMTSGVYDKPAGPL